MAPHKLLDVPLPFFEEGSLHRVQLVAGERRRSGGGLPYPGIRRQRQRIGAAERGGGAEAAGLGVGVMPVLRARSDSRR